MCLVTVLLFWIPMPTTGNLSVLTQWLSTILMIHVCHKWGLISLLPTQYALTPRWQLVLRSFPQIRSSTNVSSQHQEPGSSRVGEKSLSPTISQSLSTSAPITRHLTRWFFLILFIPVGRLQSMVSWWLSMPTNTLLGQLLYLLVVTRSDLVTILNLLQLEPLCLLFLHWYYSFSSHVKTTSRYRYS